MLSTSNVLFAMSGASRKANAMRQRFGPLNKVRKFVPLKQLKRQQSLEDMSVRRYGPERARRILKRQKYFTDLARQVDFNNKLFALNTLGDDQPLSKAADFGVQPTELLAHGKDIIHMRPPPVPYNPLVARKLASGDWWPSVREVESPAIRELRHVRPDEDSSPSSLRFCADVEYHLRRQLRACPAHIGEHIPWHEFILDRVVGSRRSQKIYIIWSTVSPEARFTVEPFVASLVPWVKRLIKQRVKNHPTIPEVFFVYNGGQFEPRVSKKLMKEVRNTHAMASQTIDERVAYLKSLDSLKARARGIPWFMPYLWKKDKVLKRSMSMRQDLSTVEERKKVAEEKANKAREEAEMRRANAEKSSSGASRFTR